MIADYKELIEKINFEKVNGLVPSVVQDNETEKVLMLGYMSVESIKKTIETKKVTFYSRSKERLWTKGETSGNFLHLVDILIDCDGDALLVKVNPRGAVCHNGWDTCWNEENTEHLGFISSLEKVIQNRKKHPDKKSYTSSLFEKGINKIAQKVGEEAVELVIESKDDNDDLFLNEAADLLFHYLVLLSAKNFSINDVVNILKGRHQ